MNAVIDLLPPFVEKLSQPCARVYFSDRSPPTRIVLTIVLFTNQGVDYTLKVSWNLVTINFVCHITLIDTDSSIENLTCKKK